MSMETAGFVIAPDWVSMKWTVVRERHINNICVVYVTHQRAGGMLYSVHKPGRDWLYDGVYEDLVSSKNDSKFADFERLKNSGHRLVFDVFKFLAKIYTIGK
jgi:hypothetical protein